MLLKLINLGASPSFLAAVERLRRNSLTTLVVVSLAMFIDSVIYTLVIPILPYIITSGSNTSSVIGLLVAAFGLGLFSCTICLGWFMEKIDKEYKAQINKEGKRRDVGEVGSNVGEESESVRNQSESVRNQSESVRNHPGAKRKSVMFPAMVHQRLMIFGLFGLIISLLLFAHGKDITGNSYESLICLYFIARILQGAAGGLTWTVGLVMLAEKFETRNTNTSINNIRNNNNIDSATTTSTAGNLGWAMGVSMSVQVCGQLVGPVAGGWLFGASSQNNSTGNIYAPFYFCISLTVLDLLGRLFVAVDEGTAGDVLKDPTGNPSSSRLISTAVMNDVTRDSSTTQQVNLQSGNSAILLTDDESEESENAFALQSIMPRRKHSKAFIKAAEQGLKIRIGEFDRYDNSGNVGGTEASLTDGKCIKLPHILVIMLSSKRLVLIWLATLTVAVVYSALEPALPVHLLKGTYWSQFMLSSTFVGSLYMSLMVPNVVLDILAGRLSDRYPPLFISSLGMIFMSICVPLLALPGSWVSAADAAAPSSDLSFYLNVILQIVTLMLVGASTGLAMTPLLPAMAEWVNETSTKPRTHTDPAESIRSPSVLRHGRDHASSSTTRNLHTETIPTDSPPPQPAVGSSSQISYGSVYAAFNAAYSLGMFVGPVVAGALFEGYGFGMLVILLGISVGIVGIIMMRISGVMDGMNNATNSTSSTYGFVVFVSSVTSSIYSAPFVVITGIYMLFNSAYNIIRRRHDHSHYRLHSWQQLVDDEEADWV